MKISDFKLTKNRQLPEKVFQYTLKKDVKKFQITTFNGGISFLATIESLNNGQYSQDFSKNDISSIDECIKEFSLQL